MKKILTIKGDQFLYFLLLISLALLQTTGVLYACSQPKNTINKVILNTLYKEDDPTKYPSLSGEQYAFLIDLTIATQKNSRSQYPKKTLEVLQQHINALTAPEALSSSEEKLFKMKKIARAIVGPKKTPSYLQGLTHSLFHTLPSRYILQAMNKRISDPKKKNDILLPEILAICNEPKSKSAQSDCILGLTRIALGTAAMVTGGLLLYNGESENTEPDRIAASAFFGLPIILGSGYCTWYGAQKVIAGLQVLFW